MRVNWGRGRSMGEGFVGLLKYLLNVYKRVISTQIRLKPSIDLCGYWFCAYIARAF